MSASDTTTATRAGRSAGRIGLIVAGALSGALALALLRGGGGTCVGARIQAGPPGGYYSTGAKHLTTPTYALVSEGLDVGVDGPDSLFRRGRLGTVRVTATGSRSHPIFVGIAMQVTDRLVSRDRLARRGDGLRGRPVLRDLRAACPRLHPLAAPGKQTFWAAKASGSNRQTMSWKVAKGDWAVVVMNADATRGVRTNVSVGAEVPLLLELGIGLLAGGGLAAVGAGLALSHGTRGQSDR